MNRRTIWFFLALLPCGGCDVVLGVDGEYTTAPDAGGGGQGSTAGAGQAGGDSGCQYCPGMGGGGSSSSSSSGSSSGVSSSSTSSSSSSTSSSSGQAMMAQPIGQIAQIITGGWYTCARTIDGQVKCWGYAQDGELGLGDLGDTTSIGTTLAGMGANLPFVKFGKGRTAVDIATSPWTPYVCAVLNDGSVSCWGAQIAAWGDINLLLPTSVGLGGYSALKVAVGRDHACALLADGGAICWGSNRSGQFGNGEAPNSTDYIPPRYENEPNLGMGTAAKAIAAGNGFTCAVLNDDTVKCWGWSNLGALGLAGTNQILNPATSPAIDFGGKKVMKIATSEHHVCALLVDKSVSCWGDNGYGQLGIGNTIYRQTPVTVPLGQPARDVAAGYGHTCVVLDDGTVRCWGTNTRGTLGLGHATNTLSPTNVADLGTGLSGAQVAAGYEHTCALLQNGTLKCWGANAYGELGIGQSNGAVGDEPNEMGDNLPNVLFF